MIERHLSEFNNAREKIKDDITDTEMWLQKENVAYLLPFILIVPIYLTTSMRRPDYIMVFATFFFGASLIPTVLNRNAVVPRKTSFTISMGIFLIMVASIDMNLILTFIGNLVSLLFWLYIFVFRGPDT